MARRIYYVVSDGEDDWGVRLDDGAVEGHTDRDTALRLARDAAAADEAMGHEAQVQMQTELGFELRWRYGQPIP
ncbi:MAG: hypothetical protein KF889_09655 [Alphaproteobacteria bacterium]|nr:hypothetical protein [Alphaproteobacteria bacterium]MCW5741087.1 hypothetical protein [Alphaproteobacteria bacterium]